MIKLTNHDGGNTRRGVFFVNRIDPEDYGLAPPRRTLPPGYPATPRCLLLVDNRCLIYADPRKPIFCDDYECLLLEQLKAGSVSLDSAKRTLRGIILLLDRIERTLPPEGSRPVLEVALTAWRNRKEEMSSGRLNAAHLLDICSFLHLIDRHLKPHKSGLFENGGNIRRG